jgi:hypothetical protein
LNAAKLYDCHLVGVSMKSAEAIGVAFTDCQMMACDFRGSRLSSGSISRCDLNGAFFIDAVASRTKIVETDLSEASFKRANLSDVTFKHCDLSGADFRSGNLTEAVIQDCELTGAKLWNIQLGGWKLKNIACRKAAFDELGEQAINFSDGQFERIYGSALRVSLTFEGGLVLAELLAIPALVEAIKNEFPDCVIGISSINELGNSAEVIITAKPLISAAEGELAVVKARLEGRLIELRDRLRSRDTEIERLQDRLIELNQKLMERLIMAGQSLTFNGPVTASVIGGNSAVSGNVSVQASNTITEGFDAARVGEMVAELTKLAGHLDQRRAAEFLAALDSVRSSGNSPTVLREIGHTVRNICEGATGSLAASGILSALARFGLI